MPGMLPSLQDRIKKVAGNKVPPSGMPPTQKPGSPTMPQGNGQPPAQPKAPNANLGKPTQPKAASAAATPGVNTKMNSAPVKNGRPAMAKNLAHGNPEQPSNREEPILPQPKVETPIPPVPVAKPMTIVEYLQVCVNKKMRKSEELVKADGFPSVPKPPKPPKVPKPKKPRQISSQKDVLAAIKSNPIHPSQEHTPKESPKVLAGRTKASQEVTPKEPQRVAQARQKESAKEHTPKESPKVLAGRTKTSQEVTPKEPQRVTQARQKESAKEVTKPSGAPKEESLPDIGVKKPYHPPAHLHLLNFLTNLANPGSPIIGKVVGAAKNATRQMGKSELFKSDENFAEKYHQKAKVVSIGKTKSGKPVMGSFDAPEHQHFSRDEHKDAQKHHLKQADIHRMSAFKTLSHEEALKHGSAAEHHEAAAHLHHVSASTMMKFEEKTPSVGPPAPLPQELKGRTKIVIPKAQAEMNQARREFNAKHADPKAKVQNEKDFHATKAQLAHRNKQSHDPGVKALGESQWKEVPTKHKVQHHIRNIIGKVRAKSKLSSVIKKPLDKPLQKTDIVIEHLVKMEKKNNWTTSIKD